MLYTYLPTGRENIYPYTCHKGTSYIEGKPGKKASHCMLWDTCICVFFLTVLKCSRLTMPRYNDANVHDFSTVLVIKPILYCDRIIRNICVMPCGIKGHNSKSGCKHDIRNYTFFQGTDSTIYFTTFGKRLFSLIL